MYSTLQEQVAKRQELEKYCAGAIQNVIDGFIRRTNRAVYGITVSMVSNAEHKVRIIDRVYCQLGIRMHSTFSLEQDDLLVKKQMEEQIYNVLCRVQNCIQDDGSNIRLEHISIIMFSTSHASLIDHVKLTTYEMYPSSGKTYCG
jgi:hypothetical protein